MNRFLTFIAGIFRSTGYFIYLAVIAVILGITLIPCLVSSLIKKKRNKNKGVIDIE